VKVSLYPPIANGPMLTKSSVVSALATDPVHSAIKGDASRAPKATPTTLVMRRCVRLIFAPGIFL
jgi:hypothetical protein